MKSGRAWVRFCLAVGAAGVAMAGCGGDDDDAVTSPAAGKAGTGGKASGGTAGKGTSGSSASGKGGSSKGGTGGAGGTSNGGTGAHGGTGATSNGGAGAAGEGGAGQSSGGAGQSGAGAGGAGFTPTAFHVPSGGGNLEMALPGGQSVSFDFPSSAAGLDITLTPDTGDSIGWGDQFSQVIHMEPDGTAFNPPIVIKPSSKDVLVFDFGSSSTKSAPEVLALNSTGDGLLLNHFSTLVVVPPGKSCDSNSGWQPQEDSGQCAEFGTASTYIQFTCKAYSYCHLFTAHCCAEPGSTDCELGMANLSLVATQTDSNGGQYPYCDQQTGSGGAAGATGIAGGGG